MKTIISVIFIATLFGSSLTLADSSPIPPSYTPSIHQIIVQSATAFNTSPAVLIEVSRCESSLNPAAVGDHGKAHGIFQYHLETFNRFSLLYGQQLDYNSSKDQAILTAFVFANYPQFKNSWTCYRNLKAHN